MMIEAVERSLIGKDSSTTGKGIQRARDILDAAREIFATGGYSTFSMRSLAAHVGVSLSTIQHYYKNRETLLEAMLVYMMNAYQAQIDEVTRVKASADRVDQFLATMDIFLADMKNPMTSGVLLELWALSYREPYAARILKTFHARARKGLSRLIRNLAPSASETELEIRATMIGAQVDGLLIRIARKGATRAEIDQLEIAARRAFVLLATAI